MDYFTTKKYIQGILCIFLLIKSEFFQQKMLISLRAKKHVLSYDWMLRKVMLCICFRTFTVYSFQRIKYFSVFPHNFWCILIAFPFMFLILILIMGPSSGCWCLTDVTFGLLCFFLRWGKAHPNNGGQLEQWWKCSVGSITTGKKAMSWKSFFWSWP